MAGVILLGLALAPAPSSAEGLELSSSQGAYDLARAAEVLQDPGGSLTLDEVSAAAPGDFSRPSTSALQLTGGEATWVRLRLAPADAAAASVPWLLEVGNYRIDEMALFCRRGPGPGGRVASLEELPALMPHEFGHRNPVFRFPSVEHGGETCFLRLRTHAPMPVPLRLWSGGAFRKQVQRDSLAFGTVYGVLAAMLLFNFFIYVSLRDRVYLFYVAYVASMLVYLLSLNGQHMPLLGLSPGQGLVMLWGTLGCVAFLALVFLKVFLDTRRSTPRLHSLLTLLQALAVTILVLGPLGFHRSAHTAAVLVGLGLAPAGLVAGAVRLSQGFRPARYFLMAWTALLLGVMTLPLKELGLLPQAFPGELATNFGAAAESILLSFALADRIRVLRREKEELAVSQARYRHASLTDGLTGLFNRRYFEDTLERAVHQAERYRRPLSLLMLDVDDFKRFNDAHGHRAGDEVLERLADLMRTSARQADAPCRYGGEEFVLLLPETGLEEASGVAERLRAEFATAVPGEAGASERTTISVGVAEKVAGEEPAALVQRADAALYRAKRLGKNRVERAESSPPRL